MPALIASQPRDFTAARLAPRRDDRTCDACSAPIAPGTVACLECGEIVRESSLVHESYAAAYDGPELIVGSGLIDGQWRLLQPIGRSPRTTVWEARDIKLDRIVAIKVMHETLSRSATHVERFEREVRLLAVHEHASLPSVLGLGRVEGRPFWVTRLLVGSTLDEQLRSKGGALPVPEAAAVLSPVGDALQSPHDAGLVHGRLCARSIVLGDDGRVTLLDLGRARGTQGTPTRSTALPVAEYLSPEQIRGDRLDPKSDVYALGCLLHEVLTGAPPFVGDRAQVMSAHLGAPRPAPIAALPAEVGGLFARMLSVDPGGRPALEEVRHVLGGLAAPAEPEVEVELDFHVSVETAAVVPRAAPTRVMRPVAAPTRRIAAAAPAPAFAMYRWFAACLAAAALCGVLGVLDVLASRRAPVAPAASEAHLASAAAATLEAGETLSPTALPGLAARKEAAESAPPVASPKRAAPPNRATVSRGFMRIIASADGDELHCALWVDGAKVGRTPWWAPVLRPGEHVLRADCAGWPVHEEVWPIPPVSLQRRGELVELIIGSARPLELDVHDATRELAVIPPCARGAACAR